MSKRLTFHYCWRCESVTVLHTDGGDEYSHEECACGGEFDPVAQTAEPGCRLTLRAGQLWLVRLAPGKEKQLLGFEKAGD